METIRRVSGYVAGRVQGVGFRYFVLQRAREENVGGHVRNLDNGCVQFELHGTEQAVAKMLQQIRVGPIHAQVTDLQFNDDDNLPATTRFVIR